MDLGILFDDKLRFVQHVDLIRSRCFKKLSCILRTAKDLDLNFNCRRTLYHAHILSIISYCSVVFNSLSVSMFRRLEAVQKRAIYSLLCMWPDDISYPDACMLFDVLPLNQRFMVYDIILVSKLLSSKIDAPDLLSSLNFYTRSQHYYSRPTQLFLPQLSMLNSIMRSQTAVNNVMRCDQNFDIFTFSHDNIKRSVQRFMSLSNVS